MANQGIDRRAALEMIGKAAIASQFPGFNRWVFGAEHTHEESAPAETPRQPYKPTFFNDADYKTIDILTELIIPADETPGARAAGVSEFIDFMGAHGEEPLQAPMRNGLAWLNSTAAKTHGDAFRRLPEEQQTAILSMAASGKASSEGRDFFQLIRRYTIMGYYTSRIGLKELDYPGLRLYAQSPSCPHTNDPEHLHLPPAKA